MARILLGVTGGIASYKSTDDFAQKEVDFILSIGGIKIEHGRKLGETLSLDLGTGTPTVIVRADITVGQITIQEG